MSKILLVDTAFSSMPIYKYLVSLGHTVFVIGNRKDDPLALIAGDNWLDIDYSQLENVKHLCDEMNFDFVVPGCTDLSIEICQQIATKPSIFDVPDVYKNLSQKHLFRELCQKLKIVTPLIYDESEFPIDGLFICKPVDSYSGRGVSVINGNDSSATLHALNKAKLTSPSEQALIETFVEGQLFSCSCFLENQKSSHAFFVKEGSSCNPYAVDTSYVVQDFPSILSDEIITSIEAMATELDLVDGLLHLQFIKADDKAFMIEVTRRCPGDLYSKLIQMSTGFDYAAKYASYFIKRNESSSISATNNIIRHTISAKQPSWFECLKFNSATNIVGFYPLLMLGNTIEADQKTRVAIAFTEELDCEEGYSAFINRHKYRFN